MTNPSTKHTPGPWEFGEATINGEHLHFYVSANGVSVVSGVRSGPYFGDVRDVEEANCRLIAAAPELLQCVEGFIFAIESGSSLELMAEYSKQAIAKATGIEQPEENRCLITGIDIPEPPKYSVDARNLLRKADAEIRRKQRIDREKEKK